MIDLFVQGAKLGKLGLFVSFLLAGPAERLVQIQVSHWSVADIGANDEPMIMSCYKDL